MRHPTRTSVFALALATLLGGGAGGCRDRVDFQASPPLRPLLYTQDKTAAPDFQKKGWEMWTTPGLDPMAFPTRGGASESNNARHRAFDQRTPKGLIRAAFFAATHGDLDALEHMILSADALHDIARMPTSSAKARYASLRNEMKAFMYTFRPHSATDARPNGLSELIQPTGIEIGLPRLVDGSLAPSAEDAQMHSANRLRIHVLGSSIDFAIRFPRLIKDSAGFWRMTEGPHVSQTWKDFRRPGLELKPALLKPQHAPFPFDVGNYWQYAVKSVPLGEGTDPDDVPPTRSLAYRDTVSSVYDGTIYRIVTLRRTYSDPAQGTQTRHLLVTARHIYACSSVCYRRRSHVRYLLGYMTRHTPLFVFPTRGEHAWREGGRTDGNTTRTADVVNTPVVVPAGSYERSVRIHSSAGEPKKDVYFEEGIGVLRVEYHQDGNFIQANLTHFRILR